MSDLPTPEPPKAGDRMAGDAGPRVAVLGAGVIGRVFASRLHAGGADTTLLARGATAERLRTRGVRSRRNGTTEAVPVPVADVATPGSFDVLLISVRAAQLEAALAVVDRAGTPVVVPLMHLAGREETLRERIGDDRIVRAFPGLGGFLEAVGTDAETVVWEALGARQPTTLDGRASRASLVADVLGRSGLPIARTDRMEDWAAAHSVFIAAMGAGIVEAGGDATSLAQDARLLRRTCDAVRDGFEALHEQGRRIEPAPLDTLHRRLPGWCAPLHWRRALPGPTGRVTMAPHVRASRWDELPLVWEDALTLSAGGRRGVLARFLTPLLEETPG